MTKRFVYILDEEELGVILAREGIPLEVLERKGNRVRFASYRPIEGLEAERVEEVDESWKEWRAGFGPVLAGNFVIIPPWLKPVFIKPGMAFGTGLHPTTRMCVELLENSVREGDSLIDVGAGSGILSIVAKKLGAGKVLAIDISADAVRECRENAEINGVKVECVEGTPSDVSERFDLLVANLELPVFRKELPKLTGLFNRVGIFSGIYGEKELMEFEDMLATLDLGADRILESEGWFAVEVRHEKG